LLPAPCCWSGWECSCGVTGLERGVGGDGTDLMLRIERSGNLPLIFAVEFPGK
jgi:hypothetical protein